MMRLKRINGSGVARNVGFDGRWCDCSDSGGRGDAESNSIFDSEKFCS